MFIPAKHEIFQNKIIFWQLHNFNFQGLHYRTFHKEKPGRPDIVDTWNNLSWQKSEIFVAEGLFFSSKPAYIWSSHSWCVNQTYKTSANWTINPRAIYLSSYDSEAICFCLSVRSGCVSSEEDKELRENFYPLFFALVSLSCSTSPPCPHQSKRLYEVSSWTSLSLFFPCATFPSPHTGSDKLP